jgi:hypothetical protein
MVKVNRKTYRSLQIELQELETKQVLRLQCLPFGRLFNEIRCFEQNVTATGAIQM